MGRPCWLNSDGLRGQVKILKEKQYYPSSPWALVATWKYDRMGKETQVWSGGEREGVPISSITATNIFNDQGQVTRQISKWNNGSPAGEVLYAYDDQGNQNVEVWYDNKGSFVSLDFREFDEQRNCIKDYEYRPSGQWTLSVQRAEYRYNNLGEKTEVVFLRHDGTKKINRYDESGLFKKSLSYAADDQLEQETEFGYDLNGNDIESRTLDSSGILISHTKDTYEYDDKKNWIKRIEVVPLCWTGLRRS